MSSRADILGRIRARLGRNDDNAVSGQAALAAYLAARPQGPRPNIEGDLVARFRAKSELLSSTVEAVDTLQQVPQAVARYLASHALPRQAVCWPELADLPWRQAGIAAEARAVTGSDLVGITGCFCALAETGTLMLCSGPATPAATSLLPETHIAIVPAARIVAGMEDAWNLARAELGELPRAVNFISGPSRTGDIEQTIVLGAHGPYRVHIVIVSDQ
ncbi:MAG: lactate utilization protein C [Betaproteobacteria bacterium]|nr:lactate utilization protein C [Betaproteobacteria bacterium]